SGSASLTNGAGTRSDEDSRRAGGTHATQVVDSAVSSHRGGHGATLLAAPAEHRIGGRGAQPRSRRAVRAPSASAGAGSERPGGKLQRGGRGVHLGPAAGRG